jgi:IS30 family transposase
VASRAQSYTNERRRRSRRNSQFCVAEWALVESVLREDYSPAQVVGWFARFNILVISHETIYRHIWQDKKAGGTLHVHLRRANKRIRKRYGSYDSRGRLAGKRHISTRPTGATNRSRIGHWEVDTVLGDSQGGACIVTLVERKTGYVVIGKLARRTASDLNVRLEALVRRQPHIVRTITADNGTEFHSYKAFEARVPLKFYFATPHHSWERGSNENMNGLIRQYLPKRVSMERVTQADCDRIAAKLNHRPRKRYNWHSPEELYAPQR